MRKLAETLYERGEMNDAYSLAAVIADIVHATGTPEFYATTPFGVCPFCGDYETVIAVDGKQYAACHEHLVYWYIGADYLGLHDGHGLHGAQGEQLRQNRHLLHTYTQIAITEAFPSTVCSCCGLAIAHAAWCIMPSIAVDSASS